MDALIALWTALDLPNEPPTRHFLVMPGWPTPPSPLGSGPPSWER